MTGPSTFRRAQAHGSTADRSDQPEPGYRGADSADNGCLSPTASTASEWGDPERDMRHQSRVEQQQHRQQSWRPQQHQQQQQQQLERQAGLAGQPGAFSPSLAQPGTWVPLSAVAAGSYAPAASSAGQWVLPQGGTYQYQPLPPGWLMTQQQWQQRQGQQHRQQQEQHWQQQQQHWRQQEQGQQQRWQQEQHRQVQEASRQVQEAARQLQEADRQQQERQREQQEQDRDLQEQQREQQEQQREQQEQARQQLAQQLARGTSPAQQQRLRAQMKLPMTRLVSDSGRLHLKKDALPPRCELVRALSDPLPTQSHFQHYQQELLHACWQVQGAAEPQQPEVQQQVPPVVSIHQVKQQAAHGLSAPQLPPTPQVPLLPTGPQPLLLPKPSTSPPPPPPQQQQQPAPPEMALLPSSSQQQEQQLVPRPALGLAERASHFASSTPGTRLDRPTTLSTADSSQALQQGDGRIILLFDINGVLTKSGTRRRGGNGSRLRAGLEHLARLLGRFRLGIFTASSARTVAQVVAAIEEEVGQQIFEPGLIMHRGHTRPASLEHKRVTGKPWETVKPLGIWFWHLDHVLLFDDDPLKAVEGEETNLMPVLCPEEALKDNCLERLVSSILEVLGPLGAHDDVRLCVQRLQEVLCASRAAAIAGDAQQQEQRQQEDRVQAGEGQRPQQEETEERLLHQQQQQQQQEQEGEAQENFENDLVQQPQHGEKEQWQEQQQPQQQEDEAQEGCEEDQVQRCRSLERRRRVERLQAMVCGCARQVPQP